MVWEKQYYRRKKNEIGRTKGEHRCVVEEEIGRPLLSDEVVHHINGIKKDNRIENLAVMSRSEHMKLHGTKRLSIKGESCVFSKLKHHNVIFSRLLRMFMVPIKDIASAFKVSQYAIDDIISKKSWVYAGHRPGVNTNTLESKEEYKKIVLLARDSRLNSYKRTPWNGILSEDPF